MAQPLSLMTTLLPLKSRPKLKLKPLVGVGSLSTESDLEVTSVHVKPRSKASSAAVGSKEVKVKGGEKNKKGKREDSIGSKVDVKKKGVKEKAVKELQPHKLTIQGQVKDILEKKSATHLDGIDMVVTVPEYPKKLKPKVPLQLVEQTSKPEMMVQDDPYDFEQNNDFGSDWDESIKLSEAAEVVKGKK